jgi:predicted anti-sigma-YlaC factor YlaD
MSCEDTVALLSDRLHGAISSADEQRLAAHLTECESCRAEAHAIGEIWDELGRLDVAVPHERLRARFHAALAAHEARANRGWLERAVALWWPRAPVWQAAVALGLAVVGVLIGQRLPSSTDLEIAELRQEVRSVGLALLDHQSAAERLLAVSWSQRIEPGPEVVAALLERVQRDSSVNVRLAAIEALRPQLDRTDVSDGLASALATQDAPLVQIALTDALLASGKAGAVAAVRQLLARTELDPKVRDYVQTALDDAVGSGAAI